MNARVAIALVAFTIGAALMAITAMAMIPDQPDRILVPVEQVVDPATDHKGLDA